MFKTSEYMKFLDKKETYIWDSNSVFGNKVAVRIVKEGRYNHMGMERPITAIMVIFKTDENNKRARNTVRLKHETTLTNVLHEIDKIVDFAEKDFIKKRQIVGDIEEVILIPSEHFELFEKK